MHADFEHKPKPVSAAFVGRRRVVLGGFVLLSALLVGRLVQLQVMENDFLQSQGEARYMRTVDIHSPRGKITDRNGEPLAISTPLSSVSVNPKHFSANPKQLEYLASYLDLRPDALAARIASNSKRQFLYLKRRVTPAVAHAVEALDIEGISLSRESRRYYPASEVFGQVIGFTDLDKDAGQEGLELAYDDWLQGRSGKHQVIRDAHRQVIEQLGSVLEADPGRDLVLSLDRRLQYMAYRELALAVQTHRASSGSAVVLDAKSGEVMAMVNQPAFNPNNRKGIKASKVRNRAVADRYEPGSTVKPLLVAAALDQGLIKVGTQFQTKGGIKVGPKLIRDKRDLGTIDTGTLIRKSSNVGASMLALKMQKEALWEYYNGYGFGHEPGSGFPSENSGRLPDFQEWMPVDQATLGYGYGMAVTTLQLARAYSVLANDGKLLPSSLLKLAEPADGQRVISEQAARATRKMLESVVHSVDGTGKRANIEGYRVAGKTGTVHKYINGAYSKDRYVSVFAGMAPATDPRFVMVVMVDDPRGEQHYGGQVAAPVFASVMAEALRIYDVSPDDMDHLRQAATGKGGAA